MSIPFDTERRLDFHDHIGDEEFVKGEYQLLGLHAVP